MASVYCPKCGASNDSSSTFCGNCGYAPQATGAATSYPPQGQQKGANEPPPPPPPYPIGNMPSSPTYLADGAPPPPYPTGNTTSSPTYPAVGAPPPPYPAGNMPSSPTYPADGANFPPATFPKDGPNSPPPERKRGRKGLVALLVIAVIVVLVGGGLGGFYFYTSHSKLVVASHSTPTVGVTATPVATLAPATPTVGTTATPASTTSTTATSVPTTSTTTTPGGVSSSYSATQPGPGCDTNGGTWTPQGIDNISCGTTITVNADNARGFLYLQLPNNETYSSNNTISVTGGSLGSGNPSCVGLAEQGANTGYLVEYCGTGNWFVYSISSTGGIVQTLTKNITSTRSSEQISLAIKGSTLTFTIDSEVHTVSISPIQPTKVAITYYNKYYRTVTVTNFSYIAS